jgi:hypothetical protein
VVLGVYGGVLGYWMRKIDLVRWFVKDQAKLDRLVEWYIHNKNLYQKGAGEATFFKSLVNAQVYVVWWLGLRSVVPDFPLVAFACAVPVVVVLKVCMHWMIGRWWDVNGYYDRESDWSNKRNPVLTELGNRMNGK